MQLSMATKSVIGSCETDLAMRTMLRTHLRRAFDSETRVEPPTFWESLSLEERRGSVNQQEFWKFENQFAWNPAGPVEEKWNTTIYQDLLRPLFRERTTELFHGVRKQSLYGITCWMVGDEWHSSHPAAIILSGDPKVSRNGVKLVKRHGQLLLEFGFRVYEYKSDILLSMTTSLMGELNNTTSFCGNRFVIKESDGRFSRMATLGGTVIIDKEYFGITVLHPFLQGHQIVASDDDYQSDLSDCDDNVPDVDINVHSEIISPDSNRIYFPDSTSQGSFIGAIPQEPRSKFFSRRMDWALVKLESVTGLLLNFVTLDGKVVIPSKVSTTFPRNPLWAIVNSTTPIQTKVSPLIHGLFLPQSGLQDVWALKMKSTLGDSGSWVVDPETESIFGVIVAGSEHIGTSYVLPAQNVFSEICERFPSMQFPLSGDPITLTNAVGLGMSQISELAITRSASSELNSVGHGRLNPLSLASSRGFSAIVLSLLRAGANPNLTWSPQSLPLHLAAYGGYLEVLRILLDFDADPSSKDVNYMMPSHPLVRAAKYNRAEVFSDAIQVASFKGHIEAVRLLLERGADINAQGGHYGNALQVASFAGYKEIVQLLLDAGADVNAQGGVFSNALQAASFAGHKEVVQLLLDEGADVNAQSGFLSNALQAASFTGHKEVFQLLLNKGADVNSQGGHYSSAMVEPIGLSSGILALAQFVFQCSVSLYETVDSFHSHPKPVRDLLDELEALSAVLASLVDLLKLNSDVELSALDLPLLRCGNVCKEFQQELINYASRSNSNRTTFRDWARLKYMGDNIDDFRDLLAGYKATINIVISDATLRLSKATVENIEEHKGLIQDAKEDLQARLESIDRKLEQLSGKDKTRSGSGAAELNSLKEEHLSTEKCLQICNQLASYTDKIQLISIEAGPSQDSGGTETSPKTVTMGSLQECAKILAMTSTKLESHMRDVMDQLLAKSRSGISLEEDVQDLSRLHDEWDTARQCLDVCSRANSHIKENVSSIIKNNGTGDALQFMVSTNRKLLYARNRGLGWRRRQVGGYMSDKSIQQLSRDLAAVHTAHFKSRSIHPKK